ncbi:hypothetical protein K1J07_04930 [Streptococcus gordonii]|uniref:hypothetical protein n=1 Tax=Streptococcus TaxID=1301 RepID=UPI0001BB562B|nr:MULTISPECIES: hypothetical protein [Streptococcus]EEY80294.1 hypothetical protein HMPREF0847_00675 [Streptococcus sp. 2_1_36FAA]MBZ2123128.1 hypothetical protein [Streptococcus gordonii]MBZ2148028.1 hypothetical protein [Streptococcus gordonii]
MDINTVITSIIASGIIGVFISEYYQRKTLVKKMKRDFVIEFFSCRFMLKDDHKGDTTELNKTLGKIPIIFSDNKQVIACYDNLFTDNSNKTLLRLIKAMCKDKNVKIDISSWDDDMIMRVLSVTKEEDIFS